MVLKKIHTDEMLLHLFTLNTKKTTRVTFHGNKFDFCSLLYHVSHLNLIYKNTENKSCLTQRSDHSTDPF